MTDDRLVTAFALGLGIGLTVAVLVCAHLHRKAGRRNKTAFGTPGKLIPPPGGSGTAKPLKTLEQHRADRAARLIAAHKFVASGVACPACGKELRRHADDPDTLYVHPACQPKPAP